MVPVSAPTLTFSAAGAPTLVATGAWTAMHCASLERQMSTIAKGTPLPLAMNIDISRIDQLDTLGAWLLERLARQYKTGQHQPALIGVPEHFRELLGKVHQLNSNVS